MFPCDLPAVIVHHCLKITIAVLTASNHFYGHVQLYKIMQYPVVLFLLLPCSNKNKLTAIEKNPPLTIVPQIYFVIASVKL